MENGDASIDDCITDYETKILSLLAELKNRNAGPIEDTRIAGLIGHFEIRTRNLRETFARSAEEIATGICERFKDRAYALQFLRNHLAKNPRIILDELEKSEEYKKAPMRIKKAKLREAKKLDPLKFARTFDWNAFAHETARRYSGEIPAAAKRGHIRAFKDGAVPQYRSDFYRSFKFRLVDFSDENLILGDSVVFFRVLNERHPFKPFTDKSAKIERIYLPLTPSRLLVGSQNATDELDSDLPAATARCALEFVISPRDSDFLRGVRSLIGEYAATFDAGEIDEIIAQASLKLT